MSWASTSSSPKPEVLQTILQRTLRDRFHLTVHPGAISAPAFVLTVGTNGLRMQPSTTAGKRCQRGEGSEKQIHLVCRGFTVGDIAELLARVAAAYVTLPVVNQTNLEGAYDLKLDWMGKRPYDAAVAEQSAGKPKDPLAVSIFDAVATLGLSLERRELSKDTIVVDSAERPASIPAGTARALTAQQISDIDRFVAAEMQREHIPGISVGVYSRGEILLARATGCRTSSCRFL